MMEAVVTTGAIGRAKINKQKCAIRCDFLISKYTTMHLWVGALPRTPLGVLTLTALVFKGLLHGKGWEERKWDRSIPPLLFYNLITDNSQKKNRFG